MVTTFESNSIGTDLKIGIVVGKFNDLITKNLLKGAISTLKSHGVESNNIDVTWVPGAFEIPLVAQRMAQNDYDTIITLGVVIRGETPHFDYVCGEVASGVSRVALETNKPVIFGIVTTNTTEQAIARSGTTAGNKGVDAAVAAIEMANLMKAIN